MISFIFSYEKVSNSYEGFYLSRHIGPTGRRSVFLAVMTGTEMTDEQVRMEKYSNIQFQMIEPHLGVKRSFDHMSEVDRKGTKTTLEVAERHWKAHYESALDKCSCIFWKGRCLDKIAGVNCDVSKYFISDGFMSEDFFWIIGNCPMDSALFWIIEQCTY